MHLITFTKNSQVSVGILDRPRSEVIDLSVAASDLPGNMLDFISLGPAALVRAQAAANSRYWAHCT